MPYLPMHPPRKQVSFERMQAILAKHAPKTCEAELFKVAQSPQGAKPPEEKAQDAQSSKPIRWRKIGENTFESDKGPVMLVTPEKFVVFDRKSENGHTAQAIGSFTQRQDALDFVRLL